MSSNDGFSEIRRFPTTTIYFVKKVLHDFGFAPDPKEPPTAMGIRYTHGDGRDVFILDSRIVYPIHCYYYATNSGIGVDAFLEKLLPAMSMTPEEVEKQSKL